MPFSCVSIDRVEANDSISIIAFSTALLCAFNTSLSPWIKANNDTDLGAENV